jgi:hypothetical protein
MDFGERSARRAPVPIEQVEAVKALAGEQIAVAIDLVWPSAPGNDVAVCCYASMTCSQMQGKCSSSPRLGLAC